MRFHFVVNPVAGRRLALPLVEAVRHALHGQGASTTQYVTTGPGDAATHVRDLEDEATDRLVVVGGDGTLREVVDARPTPLPWPVGLVPMGTANLVGREVRMPLGGRAPRVAAALRAAQPWRVDVLRLRQGDGAVGHAVANVGVGLDAEVVHAVARARAGGSGGYARWVRPIWESVQAFRFPRLRVTVDERVTYAAAACIVQNAHNYGGIFELSARAALDSGRLDVVLVKARTRRDLLRILAGALARRAGRFHDVRVVPASRVRVRCASSVAVQADGDPAGRTDLEVERVPEGLTLLRAP
jgi:diacylglycerol kinase family enzyme